MLKNNTGRHASDEERYDMDSEGKASCGAHQWLLQP
jgi:hypothetical protein